MRTLLLALAASLAASACVGGFRYRDAEPLAFDELDYGFPVEYALDDPRVAYVDVGEGPETLILVHGLASNAGFWRYNISALAEEYRVVAVDLPGYGRSEKDAEYPYTLSFQADLLRRLIEELDPDDVTVLGHSMGAQIAMVMALEHPGTVDRLVLVSPAGIESFEPGEGEWLRNVYTVEGIRLTNEEQIRRNLTLNFYSWDDDLEWMVEERARLARSTDDFDQFAHAVRESVGAMLDEPTTPWLEEVQHPTLVVYGQFDGLIPNPYLHPGHPRDVFREADERIPNSTLVEIEDAGHLVMIERPEAFNEVVLEWLEGR